MTMSKQKHEENLALQVPDSKKCSLGAIKVFLIGATGSLGINKSRHNHNHQLIFLVDTEIPWNSMFFSMKSNWMKFHEKTLVGGGKKRCMTLSITKKKICPCPQMRDGLLLKSWWWINVRNRKKVTISNCSSCFQPTLPKGRGQVWQTPYQKRNPLDVNRFIKPCYLATSSSSHPFTSLVMTGWGEISFRAEASGRPGFWSSGRQLVFSW